jgi:hypothetical protein
MTALRSLRDERWPLVEGSRHELVLRLPLELQLWLSRRLLDSGRGTASSL